MKKSEISSQSSARTREEVLRRNPHAYDGPTNREVEIRRVKRELANTADHTTKACLEARLEKLDEEFIDECGPLPRSADAANQEASGWPYY